MHLFFFILQVFHHERKICSFKNTVHSKVFVIILIRVFECFWRHFTCHMISLHMITFTYHIFKKNCSCIEYHIFQHIRKRKRKSKAKQKSFECNYNCWHFVSLPCIYHDSINFVSWYSWFLIYLLKKFVLWNDQRENVFIRHLHRLYQVYKYTK